MKLNIYAVKDNVSGEFTFIFESQNDGTMKRIIKGALLTKEQNVINTDIKDKTIYQVAIRDTMTGVIVGEASPVFVVNVSEVRLDLIKEIKIAKAEAGEDNPEAPEVASDE